MNRFKRFLQGMFYPNYQSGYCFKIWCRSKIDISFGRFNYEFANGAQAYLWFSFAWIHKSKTRGLDFQWNLNLSQRNMNSYILSRKYGRSFTNN